MWEGVLFFSQKEKNKNKINFDVQNVFIPVFVCVPYL